MGLGLGLRLRLGSSFRVGVIVRVRVGHLNQRFADPQISHPQIICVRKHQVRGLSASATVMATHVRGPSTSASRVGLHYIQ